MPANPKPLMNQYYPKLGEQFLVGLSNVGVHIVDVTMGIDTAVSNASLVAAPPNTQVSGISFGPVVHSLGVPPAVVIPIMMGLSTKEWAVNFAYVTADNSAFFFRARNGTDGVGYVRVRFVAIR